MSYGEFVPLGETSGLLDANGEIFQVYDNIMKALADQVRRITKNGNKLGVIAMTDLLRGVDANLDTSDATAIAEYILKDYTAYVNGKKITGTMPYIEGKTVTPSDTDIVAVPAGTYCMGDIIVKAVDSGGNEPIEPDEPTDYDVITYNVETDGAYGMFTFTFDAETAKPYAYKVNLVSVTGGNADTYIASVTGEFTYTDEYKVTATAVATGHGISAPPVSAEIEQSGETEVVCRLHTVNTRFAKGVYSVELYYEKGVIS